MPSDEAGQAGESSWRRSSFCASGECVEIAQRDGMIVMRNSGELDGRHVRYTAEEWHSFVLGIKAGDFDDIGR